MRRHRSRHIAHGTLVVSLGASISLRANVRGMTRGLVRRDTANTRHALIRLRWRRAVSELSSQASWRIRRLSLPPPPPPRSVFGKQRRGDGSPLRRRRGAPAPYGLQSNGSLGSRRGYLRTRPRPSAPRHWRAAPAYHLRTAQSGASKKNRGYPSPKAQGSSRGGPRELASRNARKKRPRKGRDSESRRAIPNSQDSK